MLLLWCNPSPKSVRPLRYGATGVQSHPILVTVTACRLWPTSAPKRRPAIDPKRTFTTLIHSNSRNTTAVLSSGSPWMKESPVKTATRHSLFHAHITSLFLEWKSADISVLHLLALQKKILYYVLRGLETYVTIMVTYACTETNFVTLVYGKCMVQALFLRQTTHG